MRLFTVIALLAANSAVADVDIFRMPSCGAPGAAVTGIESDFAYGRTGEVPGISCRSSREGLECRNADGRGFFLSRARQSVL